MTPKTTSNGRYDYSYPRGTAGRQQIETETLPSGHERTTYRRTANYVPRNQGFDARRWRTIYFYERVIEGGMPTPRRTYFAMNPLYIQRDYSSQVHKSVSNVIETAIYNDVELRKAAAAPTT